MTFLLLVLFGPGIVIVYLACMLLVVGLAYRSGRYRETNPLRKDEHGSSS